MDSAVTDYTKRLRIGKKSIILSVIGLASFLFYLFYYIDVNQLILIFRDVDLKYYLSAFPLVLISTFFYSLTWTSLLNRLLIKLKVQKAWSFIWIGTFVDLILPSESFTGEIARIYFTSNHLKADTGKITASVISHRILSTVLNIIGLFVGSIIFLLSHTLNPLAMDVIAIVLVGTVIFILAFWILILKEELIRRVMIYLLKFLSRITKDRVNLEKYEDTVLRNIRSFHGALRTLGGSPKGLIKPIFYGVIAWLLDLFTLLLILYSVGFETPLSLILILYSLIHTIQLIPVSILGFVGLTEITLSTILILLGFPSAISVAIALLIRFLSFWFKLLMGYISFQLYSLKTEA